MFNYLEKKEQEIEKDLQENNRNDLAGILYFINNQKNKINDGRDIFVCKTDLLIFSLAPFAKVLVRRKFQALLLRDLWALSINIRSTMRLFTRVFDFIINNDAAKNIFEDLMEFVKFNLLSIIVVPLAAIDLSINLVLLALNMLARAFSTLYHMADYALNHAHKNEVRASSNSNEERMNLLRI